MSEINKYSKTITQDPTQPAAQAMLHAAGLTDEDFKKAQVGIASTGWDGNPCNMHLNALAANKIIESVQEWEVTKWDDTEGMTHIDELWTEMRLQKK